MGGDDRLQAGMSGQRRQKRIDQSARHHEQVIEPLADESIQNEISAGNHAYRPLCAPGVPLAQLAWKPGCAKARDGNLWSNIDNKCAVEVCGGGTRGAAATSTGQSAG
jgi:hypothetical protein